MVSKIEFATFCQSPLGRLTLPLRTAGVIKTPVALITVKKDFIRMVTSWVFCLFVFVLANEN